MLKIGVTGGIGSGKTVVSHVFKHLGVPVYNADENSKGLIDNDQGLRSELVKAFGEKIYTNKGINKKYYASLIFNDRSLLEKSNSIIHPYVQRDFEKWLKKHDNAPYVIKEAAILFESGAYEFLDKIILVSAPDELRIERVINRDGLSKENILARINNQINEKEKIEKSDFIIHNDNKQLILPQIIKLHNKFKLGN